MTTGHGHSYHEITHWVNLASHSVKVGQLLVRPSQFTDNYHKADDHPSNRSCCLLALSQCSVSAGQTHLLWETLHRPWTMWNWLTETADVDHCTDPGPSGTDWERTADVADCIDTGPCETDRERLLMLTSALTVIHLELIECDCWFWPIHWPWSIWNWLESIYSQVSSRSR